MRSWILIAAAVGLASYAAVSHALKRDPVSQPPAQPAANVSAEPVVLEQVVDVTNIDSLLEPRAASDAGEPFEQIEFPARAPMEVAPARGVSAVPEVVDPSRARWYGPGRFPKQLDQCAAPDDTRGDYYRPSGVTVGIALYF
jgi:hypothetical protein